MIQIIKSWKSNMFLDCGHDFESNRGAYAFLQISNWLCLRGWSHHTQNQCLQVEIVAAADCLRLVVPDRGRGLG